MSDSLWPHRLQHSRPPYPSQLLEFTQSHVHWVGDAIQPSYPLSSPSPSAFNLSQHQFFSDESALLIRWLEYWSFSISPSNEYSGLISFSMDWLDLLAVQGLSRVFSAPQFESILFGAQPLWSSSHIHTWLLDHLVVLILLRILYTASHSGCTNLYSHQ